MLIRRRPVNAVEANWKQRLSTMQGTPSEGPALSLSLQSPPRRRLWVAGAAVLAIGLGGATAMALTGGDDPEHPVVGLDPVVHEVIYEVSGTGAAPVITWITGERNTSEHALSVPLPWRSTVSLPVGPAGGFANVEVRNAETGAGSLGCRVFVDGVQVAQQTSTDGFAGVACAHRIPPQYVK